MLGQMSKCTHHSPMILTNTRFLRRPSRLACQPVRLALKICSHGPKSRRPRICHAMQSIAEKRLVIATTTSRRRMRREEHIAFRFACTSAALDLWSRAALVVVDEHAGCNMLCVYKEQNYLRTYRFHCSFSRCHYSHRMHFARLW